MCGNTTIALVITTIVSITLGGGGGLNFFPSCFHRNTCSNVNFSSFASDFLLLPFFVFHFFLPMLFLFSFFYSYVIANV
jgi:hypothetical protein